MAEAADNILSEEEVGALFEAVKQSDDGEVTEVVAPERGVVRAFKPRSLESDSGHIERVVSRAHASLKLEAGAALGARLRLQAGLELADPMRRQLSQLPLKGTELCADLCALGQGVSFGALVLPEEVVKVVADRVLGGPGLASAPERPLSALERTVAGPASSGLAAACAKTWSETLGATVAEPEPRYDAKLKGPGQEILLAPITLALADIVLEGALVYFVDGLQLLCESDVEAPDEVATRSVGERLDRLPLVVDVRASGFALSVEELLGLEQGQALALGRAADFKLDVLVEGRSRYRGRLIESEDGRSVAIEETNS